MSQRETIARIIEPEAWKWHDRGKYAERYDADREGSLQKADDILSAIVNETLDKAEAECQSVLDGLQEWSQEYDNGFGHACDACIAKIRSLKVG